MAKKTENTKKAADIGDEALPKNIVATIEVFDRGYTSAHPSFMGNRIVQEWKVVIKVPLKKKGQKLDRYKKKDVRHVVKKAEKEAKDFSPEHTIMEWLASLKADFEIKSGRQASIVVKKTNGLGD